MFCPSTNTIKLIMISARSNEMIMTKITCHQRMKTVHPLGMYLILWKCPSYRWNDDGTKKDVKGQWYMDKMKMQDAQLKQVSGDTASTADDQSSVMGTTPTTYGTNRQGTASQWAKRPSWQGLHVHKSESIHTHSYVQTNKHMYDWILLDTCSSIDLFCNQSFIYNVHQVNTTLSLTTNTRMMTANLKAELPVYGTVWFDPQAMTNVLSFGKIAKQYPI